MVAVDKTMPKAPKALVTKLELTLVSNQLLVLSWIRNPQVVFLAPPCGTASAALHEIYRKMMTHCCFNLYVQKIPLMVCLFYKAMIFCVWSRAIFCTIFLPLFMTFAANLANCAYARTPGIHCTGIQRLGWIVNPSNATVSNVTKRVHTVLLDPNGPNW